MEIALVFGLGIIIVWKWNMTKSGKLKSVIKDAVYPSQREAYVKTVTKLYRENDDDKIWIDKSPESFEIKVERTIIDDVYQSEEYNGPLEIHDELILFDEDGNEK